MMLPIATFDEASYSYAQDCHLGHLQWKAVTIHVHMYSTEHDDCLRYGDVIALPCHLHAADVYGETRE